MKIVNIIGGLGNQMFQYAFAVALQNAFPEEMIKINTSCFRGYHLHNGFELDSIFNLDLPFASIGDLMKVSYPWVHYRLWQLGRKFFPKRKCMTIDKSYRKTSFSYELLKNKHYFDGYWQSPVYFEKYKDKIKEAFKYPDFSDEDNLQALEIIKHKPTAFIHVRRGDYLDHPILGGVCSIEYYKRGIRILKYWGYSSFIIFSNDIDWCKIWLEEDFRECDVIFATWNKGRGSYKDMQLMAECDAGLIANSSFSWWGAYLGNSEKIICPDNWTNFPHILSNIIPNEWKKISSIKLLS